MLNEEPLRFKDEFVRHKILDLLGEPRNRNAAQIDGVSIAEQLMNAQTNAP